MIGTARVILLSWLLPAMLAASLLISPRAEAAKLARVDLDSVEVRDGPTAEATVVFKLKKGTRVATSNMTTEGYYKIRAANGMTGWIPADSLIFAEAPAVDSADPAAPATAAPAKAVPANAPVGAEPASGGSKTSAWNKHFQIRAFGGMSFYSSSDANALLKFDALKNGLDFGGEGTIRVYKDLWLVFRAEQLVNALTGADNTTGATYKFNYGSTPVMAGVQFALFADDGLYGEFALLGGLGVRTQLTSTDSAGNVTSLDGGSVITGYAKFNLGLELSKVFSLFVETGYRYLKTSALTPGSATPGSAIFQGKDGKFVPTALDMSGFVANVGLVVTF